jgi:hypothetical protein
MKKGRINVAEFRRRAEAELSQPQLKRPNGRLKKM